jgi:hypothetical protein
MRTPGLVFATLVLVGCAAPQKPAGSEGGPCLARGGCDVGLTCLSELCVDASSLKTPPPKPKPKPKPEAKPAPAPRSVDAEDLVVERYMKALADCPMACAMPWASASKQQMKRILKSPGAGSLRDCVANCAAP